jgi:hypothetical protein
MTYSYIQENVPKLIVRYIFWNILRFNCDTKIKETSTEIQSIALPCVMRTLSPIDQSDYTITVKRSKCESANNL